MQIVIVHHHTVVDGVEHSWSVDPDAATGVAWVARTQALHADLAGMAQYFPHWVLAGCDQPPVNGGMGQLARCPRCAVLLVPTRAAMRCARCGREGHAEGLLWLGHIPALARPERPFLRRQKALLDAGFAQVTVGQAVYLLAPLTVLYPAEWPNVQPIVRYAPCWLEALDLPPNSASHHLIHNGRACLFSWGQWRAMPVHAVLQQRVVNHVASLLKIAAGQPPSQAFIGRIYDRPWRAESEHR